MKKNIHEIIRVMAEDIGMIYDRGVLSFPDVDMEEIIQLINRLPEGCEVDPFYYEDMQKMRQEG